MTTQRHCYRFEHALVVHVVASLQQRNKRQRKEAIGVTLQGEKADCPQVFIALVKHTPLLAFLKEDGFQCKSMEMNMYDKMHYSSAYIHRINPLRNARVAKLGTPITKSTMYKTAEHTTSANTALNSMKKALR